VENDDEQEEDSSFISFLQNAISATIEATKEIGLKGSTQCCRPKLRVFLLAAWFTHVITIIIIIIIITIISLS
jgi:hypothetical protein